MSSPQNFTQKKPINVQAKHFSTHVVLISGFIAGVVSRTITAPMDRISICMRAGGTVHAGKSLYGTISSMVKHAGVKSLWRGNGVNCIQVGPESALTFFCYEFLKTFLRDPLNPTGLQKFVFGAISGAFAMTVVYPLYLVQARMCVAEPHVYKGIFDCFKQTIVREGAASLFKGYNPSFVRILPYKGFDMCIFNSLKNYYIPQGEVIDPFRSMLFGGLASAFSQSTTYPLVLVRTKLQAQGEAQQRPILYSGIYDTLKKTVYGDAKLGLKPEGVRGLYVGCLPNLLKMVPAVALQFTVYEGVLSILDPYFQRRKHKS